MYSILLKHTVHIFYYNNIQMSSGQERNKTMSVKINTFELENVKRIKAVAVEPTASGLTVIGGKNNQGKTSVLDAIAWALGGDRFRPSGAAREGALTPPHLKVTLSNGVVVERRGKNSDLKVIDPSGRLGGQALLNSFIEAFALDLPRFMNAPAKEKADTLLQVIGVGDKLFLLEKEESALYNERTVVGRTADAKKKYADGLTYYDDAPTTPVSATELIRQQQDILLRNAENRRKRDLLEANKQKFAALTEQVEQLKVRLQSMIGEQKILIADIEEGQKEVAALVDESTAALEANIADIEEINRKVNENMRVAAAEDEAEHYKAEYDKLTAKIEDVRKQKYDLLNNASLPLPGLSVDNGELTFNGHKWDALSGSEQLRVATAIVRKLNPECGFVLLDKLEQMDTDTLKEFGEWLEREDLQAIATRVSTGDECSIIIEDGYATEPAQTAPPAAVNPLTRFGGWGSVNK